MPTETSMMRVADGMLAEHVSAFTRFMRSTGIHGELPGRYTAPDSYSDIITTSLRSERIDLGRITCSLTVTPSLLNTFGGLHGGAVAAIAERVSIACVRTVVGKDTDLFLGELGMSYLSSAAQSVLLMSTSFADKMMDFQITELTVIGSVIRSGRNVTMVIINLKIRDTGKLVSTARAIFYTTATAKL